MAYCSKCGAEVQGSFCSNCGNPVNTLSVQQESRYNEPNVHSVGDFIYTDEDLMNDNHHYFRPHFKPDFSKDTFFGMNYICHLVCLRRIHLICHLEPSS